MIKERAVVGCLLSVSLVSCAYFKDVPDNAEAFQAGLRCNMSQNEVKQLAVANEIDNVDCRSLSSVTKESQCDVGEGRASYLLLFGDDGGLFSVQPGYVYDLTHLTYNSTIELCN